MYRSRGSLQACLRPAALGLLTAISAALVLICTCSLVFVILKSVADAAVVPLALLSVSIGCFVGAYVSTTISGRYGLLFGLSIAALLFIVIWIISVIWTDSIFGTENVVRLVLLIAAGCSGGILGCARRHRR